MSTSEPSSESTSSVAPTPSSAQKTLSIEITPAAAAAAKRQLLKRGTPEAMIRLGIKGGGCSGFSYVIQVEDAAPRERDCVFERDGAKFVVDKKSLLYLSGTTVDWKQTLMQQGFDFINPHVKSNCGCGHSFQV
ncbi:MAG: HesB/IscA family protein [Polyangiales bacterium]